MRTTVLYRPVDFREVKEGFHHHSFAERRLLYALVFALSGMLLWTHSTRLLWGIEAARVALLGRYEVLQSFVPPSPSPLVCLKKKKKKNT